MVQRFFGCLAASLCFATACSTDVADQVGLTASALSICNETVPADRNIDGIPAYEQCAAAESSAIYSNNGVDTSTKKMGSDWYETQYDNGYQCTEFVVRYMYFKWKVTWLPDEDAGFWCDKQPPADSGITLTMTPVHGDIMVFPPGACGSDDEGHVGVVDQVKGSTLVVVEENDARRGDVMMSCAKCFLHATANTGAAGASGSAGAGGSNAAAAGSGASNAAAGSNASRPTTTTTAAAGSNASKPTTTTTAAAASNASKPTTTTTAAAGSSASTQLTNAVSTTPSVTSPAPAEKGCSVAAISGGHKPTLPLSLLFTLLAGAFLRARRR